MRTEITIPASTSNLGASFDACGLALALYLRVTVEERASGFDVVLSGDVEGKLPRDESNLILRVARSVAELRGKKIDGARLSVNSEIPLARGLGSSSSAIIAGISVYEALTGDRLTEEELLGYALRFDFYPVRPFSPARSLARLKPAPRLASETTPARNRPG